MMQNNEPQHILRIRDELRRLMGGSSIVASLHQEGGCYYVYYHSVPTAGEQKGLPALTDVVVPVPDGYPSTMIDMPALPVDSTLIPHVVGGSNPQNMVTVDNQQWRVLSYHPYANGGGPPWNPMIHGYHDYYHHVFTWLHRLI